MRRRGYRSQVKKGTSFGVAFGIWCVPSLLDLHLCLYRWYDCYKWLWHFVELRISVDSNSQDAKRVVVARRVALGTGEEIQMAKDCWCRQQTLPFPLGIFCRGTPMHISHFFSVCPDSWQIVRKCRCTAFYFS